MIAAEVNVILWGRTLHGCLFYQQF